MTDSQYNRAVADDRDGFGARHREARTLQLEFWADEIVDLADRGDLDPRDRAVRIDTRKWLMSKLAPRNYGDRLLHAGDPDAPIRHEINFAGLSVAELDALEALATARLAVIADEKL